MNMPHWQTALTPDLIDRLFRPQTRPGCINVDMARALIARFELPPSPLLSRLIQRQSHSSRAQPETLPIVYALPATPTPVDQFTPSRVSPHRPDSPVTPSAPDDDASLPPLPWQSPSQPRPQAANSLISPSPITGPSPLIQAKFDDAAPHQRSSLPAVASTPASSDDISEMPPSATSLPSRQPFPPTTPRSPSARPFMVSETALIVSALPMASSQPEHSLALGKASSSPNTSPSPSTPAPIVLGQQPSSLAQPLQGNQPLPVVQASQPMAIATPVPAVDVPIVSRSLPGLRHRQLTGEFTQGSLVSPHRPTSALRQAAPTSLNRAKTVGPWPSSQNLTDQNLTELPRVRANSVNPGMGMNAWGNQASEPLTLHQPARNWPISQGSPVTRGSMQRRAIAPNPMRPPNPDPADGDTQSPPQSMAPSTTANIASPPAATAAAPTVPTAAVDLDALVQKVERKLKRNWVVERERRGWKP